VESLQAADGALHPVQQAMVDHHGSQCGFCTPGFVMSLFALYLQGTRRHARRCIDALTGNLCRCTGYRPIIDAGSAHGQLSDACGTGVARGAHTRAAVAWRLLALVRQQPLRLPGFYAPRSVR
jgi:xanthine dehydrogenase small subunit